MPPTAGKVDQTTGKSIFCLAYTMLTGFMQAKTCIKCQGSACTVSVKAMRANTACDLCHIMHRRCEDVEEKTGEDDSPNQGEVEPSERIWACASSRPVALAFDDPIAGAAFCPSPPMGNLCMARNADEFAVDTVDSAGLLGRSTVCGRSIGGGACTSGVVSTDSGRVTGLRGSRDPVTGILVP